MATFTEEFSVDDYEVLTDSGWESISSIGKTIPYYAVEIETETNRKLRCADMHILYSPKETFATNLSRGDKIITQSGEETITKITNLSKEEMYDLCLLPDSKNHRYYTNGFLSHNSTIYSIFAAHYVLFNKDRRVLMVANKESTVKELLQRIKMAWTLLPNFLKIGITSWNTKKINFENGSSITVSATSPDSARGSSCDVCLDDTAWVFIKDIDGKQYQVPISSLIDCSQKIIDNKKFHHKFLELLDTALKYENREINDLKVLIDPERLTTESKYRSQLNYHIENRNLTVPVCPICGKKMYERFRNGKYYTTCSVKCSKKFAKFAVDLNPDYKGIKILTERGYEPFDGISISDAVETVNIELDNGEKIVCSESHKLMTNTGFKTADEIKFNDKLIKFNGDRVGVSFVTRKRGCVHLYDVLNSGETHTFLTTSSIISHNCILDEAAFIQNSIMEEFVASVFPTISSKPSGKIIAVSTPNGTGNWFAETYFKALYNTDTEDNLTWKQVTFPWYEHPYRDEDWKKRQLAMLGGNIRDFRQEFECCVEKKSSYVRVYDKKSKIFLTITGEELENLLINEQ